MSINVCKITRSEIKDAFNRIGFEDELNHLEIFFNPKIKGNIY